MEISEVNFVDSLKKLHHNFCSLIAAREHTILCDVTRTCLPKFVDYRTEQPRVSKQHPAERHEPEEVETGDVAFGATSVKHPLDV